MNLEIYTDGGSRGNPGIAGGGVFVKSSDSGSVVFEKSSFYGKKTNNESEYMAFVEALEWLSEFSNKEKIESVTCFLDSKLVVEQVNKNWRVKEVRLQTFVIKSWRIIESLPYSIKIKHVPRNKNKEADALANQAMDAYSE